MDQKIKTWNSYQTGLLNLALTSIKICPPSWPKNRRYWLNQVFCQFFTVVWPKVGQMLLI